MRFEKWSQADAAREVPQRLKDALTERSKLERSWRINERMLFNPQGEDLSQSQTTVSYDALAEWFGSELDQANSWISINYMMKYLRYIHAQMSANPPSVMAMPTSTEYKDRRAAEVADNLVTYGRRQYRLQDRVDLTSLQTLTYGTGVFKMCWDSNLGEVLDIDRAKQELTMTGDIAAKPLLIWDIALDHTAKVETEIRYVFERHVMSAEEAKYRWPKHADALTASGERSSKPNGQFWDRDPNVKGVVEVWEYTEKALPWNGMAGRHCFLLADGTMLSDIETNPNPDGVLPYFILTDIDVPGKVYGRTFIDYLVRLQDVLNRLDSTILDQIQAHGVVRMVLYDAAEVQDGSPSTSTWEVARVKGTAAQKPDFINPPTLMPDIHRFREQLLIGMEQLAGVNESMFGQVQREMSGFSLQTAINAGNMIRRRLFNKYELFVEGIYRNYLRLIQVHWTDSRKVLVAGTEHALSVAYYSNADLEGGFDLDVKYGASFSLDPASRREEIMQLLPLLKDAGYSLRTILGMLRLNDVAGLFDMATVSKRRQLEIFDEMVAKYEDSGVLVYIPPQELEEHEGMLEAAYEFRMSSVYKMLDRQLQPLVEQHIREREQLLTQAAARKAGASAPGQDAMAGLADAAMIPQGVAPAAELPAIPQL